MTAPKPVFLLLALYFALKARKNLSCLGRQKRFLLWYEQKAVCILLTLLHLGIRNIRLGPTLPAFLSPNVLQYLVEHYAIAPITTPEADLAALLG